MARAEHGARFSAAPAPRPAARIAQPNFSHSAPMNAHAQMAPPRAAAPAAMPHVGGGAPAMGGAAHVGGGAPGGGGQGRHH
jgi:hypothetical protein